jgi:hypothetical protein
MQVYLPFASALRCMMVGIHFTSLDVTASAYRYGTGAAYSPSSTYAKHDRSTGVLYPRVPTPLGFGRECGQLDRLQVSTT